jgi:uncharacterized protein (DUF2141 family)
MALAPSDIVEKLARCLSFGGAGERPLRSGESGMARRIRSVVVVMAVGVWMALAAAVASGPVTGEEPERGSLSVVVVGLENDKGQVVIALLDSAEAYDEEKLAFREAMPKIEGGKVSVTFDDIPYGTYALKVIHDENGNGKLDTNFMGIPKEHFGFSNNAMGSFGPPDFEQAKFAFEAPHMTMEIKARGLRS